MNASIMPAVLGIASLVVVALVFLFLGNLSAKRESTGHGDLFPTLHLLAIVAALVGAGVVGVSFATDHPMKWLHLGIPFLFVAIVYGYALGANRVSWKDLLKDIRSRIRASKPQGR